MKTKSKREQRLEKSAGVIVRRGYPDEPVILEHRRHGFMGALAKPFDRKKSSTVLPRVLKVQRKA